MDLRSTRRAVAPSLAVLAVALAAQPAAARFTQAGTPSVVFTVAGPAGIKIVGTSSDCVLSEDAQTLSLTVALSSFSTGVAFRDRDLRQKYLEVQRFPDAVLRVQRADLELPSGDGVLSGFAPGTLRLHGREHLVTIFYHVRRVPSGFQVDGTLRLSPGDYGIELPEQLGASARPEVQVVARFGFADR